MGRQHENPFSPPSPSPSPPLLAEPKLHVVCTSVGLAMGVAVHSWEESRAKEPSVYAKQDRLITEVYEPLKE